MKRVAWWMCGTSVLAGTVATAFASSGTLGPAALAVLEAIPDSAAFLAVGVGLVVFARRRARASH